VTSLLPLTILPLPHRLDPVTTAMTPFLFLSVARLDLRERGRDPAASRGMGDVRGRLVGARHSKPRPLAFCAFPVGLLLTTRVSSRQIEGGRLKGGRAAQSTARQSARQLLMISFSAERHHIRRKELRASARRERCRSGSARRVEAAKGQKRRAYAHLTGIISLRPTRMILTGRGSGQWSGADVACGSPVSARHFKVGASSFPATADIWSSLPCRAGRRFV
jgi:hypothetical protein